MVAVLIAGVLPFAMPWDKPAPPPEKSELVLTQPQPPEPTPDGSVIDLPDAHQLPINWRSTEKISGRAEPGLAGLMASGSGQFSRDQFYAVLGVLRGKNIVIVDLRQEPHTFLNGAAVTWGPPDVVGASRSATQVEQIETAWTHQLARRKFTTLTQFAPGAAADARSWQPIQLKLDIREARTEARLVARENLSYLRIAMPDTYVPRDEDVDRFIAFLAANQASLPWLYFHCDTGGNRTTLFLTLYDMMRNYYRVQRPKIIARQRKIGGIDLLAGPGKAERAEFLERFFSYCWQSGPMFHRSWSSWSRDPSRRAGADPIPQIGEGRPRLP